MDGVKASETSEKPILVERRELSLELERVGKGWQWVAVRHWKGFGLRFSCVYPNLGAAERAWREGKIRWVDEAPMGTAEQMGGPRFPVQVAESSGFGGRSSATVPVMVEGGASCCV